MIHHAKKLTILVISLFLVLGFTAIPARAEETTRQNPTATESSSDGIAGSSESTETYDQSINLLGEELSSLSNDTELAIPEIGYIVRNMDDLVAAFGSENVTVTSATDMKFNKDVIHSDKIPKNIRIYEGTYKIDFNGYHYQGCVGFYVLGGNVTLLDSSPEKTGGIVNEAIVNDDNSVVSEIIYQEGGQLTIESGRYTSPSCALMSIGGELRILDGEFLEIPSDLFNVPGPVVFCTGTMNLIIEGGVFRGTDAGLFIQADETNQIRISGGLFEAVSSESDVAGIRIYTTNETPKDVVQFFPEDVILLPGKLTYSSHMITTAKKVMVVSSKGVTGFVCRLYAKALGREADMKGLEDWVSQLQTKKSTGAGVAYGFFFSPEFIKKNVSDGDYITLLYRVFFDREPDAAGKLNWLRALENGASRKYVFAGFSNSQEWKSLCESYSILPGSYTSDEPRDQNLKVTAFVQRLYTLCLNRKADIAGMNDWTSALNSRQKDGAHVAYGFFFSPEFTSLQLSNEAYVEVLYEVFLGRASDRTGKADWVAQLSAGTSRMDVFRGFAHSLEFDGICKDYGIVRGTV